MPRILIVGGGYAGFYTALKLEKWLRKGEAEVVLVDPLPYMTYQPFLPEVAAGSIEARHSVVALRRHLKRSTVITAKVTGIDHAHKLATITPPVGEPWQQEYDQIVVTAGAVSRTFPIPGIADNAIGLKSIEEAVAIRDRLMSNFDKAALLPRLAGVKITGNYRCAGHEYRLLASGGSHFSVYSKLMPWDHLAGCLLVAEAGGHVGKPDGSPYTPRDKEGVVIAACDASVWTAARDGLLPR